MRTSPTDANEVGQTAPAAVPAQSPYTIRSYQTADEGVVLDLLCRTLPRWARFPDPAEVWHWKHFANPFGESRILLATIEGRVAGVAAIMRWQVVREGRIYLAARGVDVATEPSLSRTGVASQIAAAGYLVSQELGLSVLFFTPNQNSTRMAERNGRQSAGVVRPQVRVVRPLHAGLAWWRSRRDPGYSYGEDAAGALRGQTRPVEHWLGEERTAIEDLLRCDQERDEKCFRTARTWEYLNWRYVTRPHLRSHVVVAHNGDRLDGALIFRVEKHRTARRVVLEDLLLRGDDDAVLRSLRKALKRTVAADLIQCSFPESTTRRLLGGRTHFRGRGYGLVIRRMDPDLGEVPFRHESWQLTLGDLREF